MLKINKILCIGDTSIDTDYQCREISKQSNIPYCGIVSDSIDSVGCYHVSLGDKSIAEVEALIAQVDKTIFLDQMTVDELGLQTQILKNTHGGDQHVQIKPNNDDILFVGCSHTAGIGHYDQTNVYTSILAKKLQLQPIVEGHPGQGNYVIEDVLSKYALANSNVIIQFTDIFRIRYYDSSSKQIVHKQGKHFSKLEIDMFDEERLTYEFKQLVTRVVSKLRDSNVRFLFFQLSNTTDSGLSTNLFMSSFKEYCWTPDINVDLAHDNLHFGPASHNLIATRLLNKWNKLYA